MGRASTGSHSHELLSSSGAPTDLLPHPCSRWACSSPGAPRRRTPTSSPPSAGRWHAERPTGRLRRSRWRACRPARSSPRRSSAWSTPSCSTRPRACHRRPRRTTSSGCASSAAPTAPRPSGSPSPAIPFQQTELDGYAARPNALTDDRLAARSAVLQTFEAGDGDDGVLDSPLYLIDTDVVDHDPGRRRRLDRRGRAAPAHPADRDRRGVRGARPRRVAPAIRRAGRARSGRCRTARARRTRRSTRSRRGAWCA